MTAAPDRIAGLSHIAGRYRAALVDIWGVVHNGREVFGPAVEACRRFRAAHGPITLVSNSPRPGADIPRQIAQLGGPTDFYDAIVTSGDATRAELARRAPGPAFKIGPDRDDPLYEGTGLGFAPLETAAFLSATGLYDDTAETPADYADLLAAARARDLDMVCANPDVRVRRGDDLIYAAGALAEAYAALGGRVILCGKPHPPIYRLAFEALAETAGGPVAASSVLAIGDGPVTDLAGAAAHGLDALFIADGVVADDLAGPDDRAGVRALLERAGARARYVAPALTW